VNTYKRKISYTTCQNKFRQRCPGVQGPLFLKKKKKLDDTAAPLEECPWISCRWLNKDRQLDVTCFIISLFTAHHVSNVSTSIFTSLRLIVGLFHVLYCSGSMCVVVTVWLGWGGVVSLCRLPHHPSLTTPLTPTHIEPEYNP